MLKVFKDVWKDAWLENEIELRKEDKTRTADEKDDDALYFNDCIKAYKSVMGIVDSSDSAEYVKNLLVRLIDRKPLTPIENNTGDWAFLVEDPRYFQHKRYGSLLKKLNGATGKYTYFDVDKYDVVDFKTNEKVYGAFVRDIIEYLSEKDPITFPYMPPTYNIKVYITKLEDREIYIHGWIDSEHDIYQDIGRKIKY